MEARTLCLIMSRIPCFNDWRNSREGREEWDDPEFYPFKSWTRGPSDFSCQALAEGLKENSTLTNLRLAANWIADEGAKAWCLVWMVWRRESEPQDFIGRTKIQPLENEVNEMLKGPESNAQCILSLLISNERQVRGNIVLQCFPGWGTSKGRYIGPQMCYVRTFVHWFTLGQS